MAAVLAGGTAPSRAPSTQPTSAPAAQGAPAVATPSVPAVPTATTVPLVSSAAPTPPAGSRLPTAASSTALPPTTTSTATPAAPAAPAPSHSGCGGQPNVDVNGQTWQCSFDEEFNRTTWDASKWDVQQTADGGYHSGLECFEDGTDNESVSGGTLHLTVEQSASSFLCPGEPPYDTQYTSGMVSTYQHFIQTDGLFEVPAKISGATTQGLQSCDPAATNDHCVIGDPSQFHTYAVQWTAQSLTFLYDGQTCLVDHWTSASPLIDPAPFNEPFYICLTQALGIGTNDFMPGSTPLPATTSVDWVRVWGVPATPG